MSKIIRVYLLFLVLVFIAACGGKSEKEYFDNANGFIEDKNFAEAVVELQGLIDEYPSGEYTSKALLELGKIYHSKSIKTISSKESLEKAVEYYLSVYEKYPGEKDSPNALFMAGFIEANELSEYDRARELYNLFLEKYPENELAFSARYELQNLGKSPEDILEGNNTEAK